MKAKTENKLPLEQVIAVSIEVFKKRSNIEVPLRPFKIQMKPMKYL